MDRYRYLVLPPEASTNWVFDDSVLFNLLVGPNRFIMDRRDYYRYRRLAGFSDVDFYKYFTLTLLVTLRLIRFLDYQNWYTSEAIVRSWDRLRGSHILNEPNRFIPGAVDAYGRYRKYVGGKRPFLELTNDAHGLARLNQETASADHDLALLHSGRGDTRHLVAYLSRLSTKLLAAESIALSLRSAGFNADVFDSMEYRCGSEILSKSGVALQVNHAAEMFEASGAQVKVTEELNNRGIATGETMLGVSVRLLLGIKEDLSGSMVGRLRAEIKDQGTFDGLAREVEDCVQNKLWPKEDYRKMVESLNSKLAIVEVFWSTLGRWGVGLFTAFVGRVLPSRDYDSGYTLPAQLIARAVHLYKKDARRYRATRSWVNWFRGVFLGRPLEDSVWESSQRDMKDWTNPMLYVPWWEGGGLWQFPLWTPVDIWERRVKWAYIRSKKKQTNAKLP